MLQHMAPLTPFLRWSTHPPLTRLLFGPKIIASFSKGIVTRTMATVPREVKPPTTPRLGAWSDKTTAMVNPACAAFVRLGSLSFPFWLSNSISIGGLFVGCTRPGRSRPPHQPQQPRSPMLARNSSCRQPPQGSSSTGWRLILPWHSMTKAPGSFLWCSSSFCNIHQIHPN